MEAVLGEEAEEKRQSRTRMLRGAGGKKAKSSKSKACRKILKANLKEFGDNTTFHGLRYVTNDTYHAFRRFFWLLVVVAMTTLLSVDITHAIARTFQYPEMSSISVHYPQNITFPAVTLCNINLFRSDALSPSQVELLNSVFAKPASHIDMLGFTIQDRWFPSFNDSQLMDNLVAASHRIKDMLLSCRWLTSKCSSANFTQRLTDNGVCYTFNDPSPGGAGEPLVVRNPGSRNGLFMRLNVEQYLYTNGESTAAGLKVLLHQQGEYPMVKEFAFSLSPGFETSIVVQQNVPISVREEYIAERIYVARKTTLPTTNAEESRSVFSGMEHLKAPYYSNCTDGYWEKFPFKYSAASCRFACKVDYVIQKCGCRDFRWPGTQGDVPICSLDEQVNCISRYEDEFLSEDQENLCNCPIACETIAYGREISFAYWPASYRSMELQKHWNATEDFIRKNYLDVYIYFEEIKYTKTVQIGAYTFENLQSDIGGYLGLLCGMSLMTLLELADFILVALFKKLKR